jgi:predicted RNase H-like HicB family nuclease
MVKTDTLDRYPIEVYLRDEKGDRPYFIAFLPDFGETVCSGVGDTVEEALQSLEKTKLDVTEYYRENNKPLPKRRKRRDDPGN